MPKCLISELRNVDASSIFDGRVCSGKKMVSRLQTRLSQTVETSPDCVTNVTNKKISSNIEEEHVENPES